MYILKVSDNNNISAYEFDTKAEATKERTQLICAYGYRKANGWTRENDGDVIYFRHAIYSTVVFEVYSYKGV